MEQLETLRSRLPGLVEDEEKAKEELSARSAAKEAVQAEINRLVHRFPGKNSIKTFKLIFIKIVFTFDHVIMKLFCFLVWCSHSSHYKLLLIIFCCFCVL